MSDFSTNNPLAKHFRQPTIYLKLPSEGSFWPEGSLELPVTGEIPVYPLTTKDEIILRTPDALLNGEGVVEVIQSCCPNIKNAWEMPSIDVDAVLIGIRIASYGDSLEQESKCPHCNEENTHTVELTPILGNIKSPVYGKIKIEDLSFKIKPQKFFGVNKVNAIEFEEEKIRQALALPDTDADLRAKELAKSIERLIDVSLDTITNGVEYIELADGTIVSEPNYIKEFFQNAKGTYVDKLKSTLAELNQATTVEPAKVHCGSCEKEYLLPLVFDYSNFFVAGS